MKRLILFFAAVFVFSILLLILVVYRFNPPNVGIEYVKALVQVITITILGNFIALVVDKFRRERREYDTRQEFRKNSLTLLSRAYADTKLTRRLVRARGLQKPNDQESKTDQVILECYDKYAPKLSEVQLTFESIRKEIETSPHIFSATDVLVAGIKKMDDYLNEISREYQEEYPRLRQDGPLFDVDRLERFHDFVGPYDDSKFKAIFVNNFVISVGIIRNEILNSDA